MIDDFGSISEYERQCMEEQLEGYGHGQKMISETASYLDEIRTTLGAL